MIPAPLQQLPDQSLTYGRSSEKNSLAMIKARNPLIVWALYGLKSSQAAFRNHLAECMYNLSYKSCLADPDLWYKPEAKPDGTEYYSYILCYVDDILVIHHDAMLILTDFDKHFKLKPGF